MNIVTINYYAGLCLYSNTSVTSLVSDQLALVNFEFGLFHYDVTTLYLLAIIILIIFGVR